MRRRRRSPNPLATINVTPLVDVMLVLLIVFLVTATLGQRGIPLDLPRAPGSAPAPATTLSVSLDAQGRLWVDGAPTETGALPSVIQAKRASPGGALVPVLFRVDRVVPYGRFVQVLDLLQSAGAGKLTLETTDSE